MTRSLATCSLCDALCGVVVEHDADRVLSIRGDADDPFSKGHVCPKVVGLQHVHHDPDRLRRPLKRGANGEFHEVSWDDAVREAGERLGRLQRTHGKDAVALYVGNPTVHSYGALFHIALLHAVLGTRNQYSANSMDSLPRQLASQLLYGSPFLLPIPDIDRTKLFVVLGANPAVSNGSIMTAPGMKQRMRALRERGGHVIVIDPRRTETSALADEHHFIRPGTDAHLLASIVHTLFADGLVRPAPAWVDGVDAVRAACAPFGPERTAPLTGIAADTVRALARALATAESAVIHARIGTSTQAHGVVSSWLVDVIHVLTGRLDHEGGAMFAQPPVSLGPLLHRLRVTGHYGRWRSRVRGLPEVNGELPIATLADEIDTPGAGQVRGLVLHAGNIARSAPNSRRMEASLASLDTVVAVDMYLNETTRHAHFILPPRFGLEHDHFPLLLHGVAVRNGAHWSPAVLPPAPDARDDWQILAALSAQVLRARVPLPPLGALASTLFTLASRALPPRRLLDVLLRMGPHRLSLRALAKEPHGRDLGPLAPRLPGALLTRGRRVQLAPDVLLRDLAEAARSLDAPDPRAGVAAGQGAGLVLIGRRDLRSVNSWLHNVEALVKGERRCSLFIHPDDARSLDLVDGGRARVTSRSGTLDVDVEVTDTVMRGVISLPHGWGHDAAGARLSVAARHPGVNLNVLTDDQRLDQVSACVAWNGVPVRVDRLP